MADFIQLQTGVSGGFNEVFDAINENFQKVEDDFLQEVTASDLPVGGSALGAVKNGGNVTINSDGTMTVSVPDGGIMIAKATFTIGDVRWGTLDPDGTYSLVIPNAGASFFGVFMEVSTGNFKVPVVDVEVTSTNTTIKSMNKFAGYILQGTV